MSLIFCYDEVDDNGVVFSKIYKTDFETKTSPVNLGWAGYSLPPDIKDEDLKNSKMFDLLYPTHTYNLKEDFDIKIKRLADIQNNEKYFYVVDVFPYDFWVKDESKDPLFPKKVLKDIRRKNAKILVLFSQESLRHSDQRAADALLEAWITKYNLPEQSIILSSGTYNFEPSDKIHVKYIPFSLWQTHGIKVAKINFNLARCAVETRMIRNKTYLSYNRRPHIHRQKLIYLLHTTRLLKHGLVSMGKVSAKHRLPDIPKKIFDMLPISFDHVDLRQNQAGTYFIKDFLNTYMSIVTETLHTIDLFPSEKIFKAIIMGHPFFVISSKGFLEMLKDMGYMTFDKWFDESYDKEEDLDKRIYKVVHQLNKFVNMSHIDLANMMVEMLPVLTHNFNNYIRMIEEKGFQKELENELCK